MNREMKPCPFPHEVSRRVFIERDDEDFFIVRVSCSDCGCCGPFVNMDDDDTKAAEDEAIRLWNTRSTPTPTEGDVERVARAICESRGLSPDTLYQHNFEGDWPEDDRRDYRDPFTDEPRTMLFHKGWRRYEKDARAALAVIDRQQKGLGHE